MHIYKQILWWTATLILAYVLFVISMVFSPYFYNFCKRTEFDQELWKEWKETDTDMSLRWDMVHDMTSEYKLISMTKEDITALLGPPDNMQLSSDTFHYYLGMSRHGIDTGSLIIKFNVNKVISYRIRHG